MVIGDLNAEVNLECMKHFCETFGLNSLIKVPTCYVNPKKPSCNDLLLTNQPKSFQSSSAVEAWLSDFHKMTVTVIKTTFKKLNQGSQILRTGTNFVMKNLGHNFK